MTKKTVKKSDTGDGKYFDPKPGFNWITGWYDPIERESSSYEPHIHPAHGHRTTDANYEG